MDITIRDATASDANAIVTLLDELGKPTNVDVALERLRLLAGDGGRALLAIRDDGTPVGLMTVSSHVTLHNPGPVAYITALVTSSKARRSGAGRALVAQAIEWARYSGCSRLSVSSNLFRTEAHDFYEACGLPCSGKRFSAALDELP